MDLSVTNIESFDCALDRKRKKENRKQEKLLHKLLIFFPSPCAVFVDYTSAIIFFEFGINYV